MKIGKPISLKKKDRGNCSLSRRISHFLGFLLSWMFVGTQQMVAIWNIKVTISPCFPLQIRDVNELLAHNTATEADVR